MQPDASRTSNGSYKQHFDELSVNESKHMDYISSEHRGVSKIKEGDKGLRQHAFGFPECKSV